MYKLYKDEFEELENPTLEDIMSCDVYGIRISNDTESDLPYLFKNSKYLLNDENLSSYRWFKHKSSGSEYKEFVSSSGIFCKIQHDKAIEFIKRYRGLYILESEQYEKLTKNEYSPYKEGRIETDITNIDNGGELSAYIKAKYYNLYIMYLLEQKIDHDSIVQINADEAASWLSLKLPLETIYAYDGTDVTIIYVSGGYIRSRPGYANKNDVYKAEGSAKIGYDQIKSILDTKYKNCKFFKYTDMPDIKTNHVNGDQYIEIDSKYAVDFIKSGKEVFKIDKNNTITDSYISWYDNSINGCRACNVDLSKDLSKDLFVDRKDYYDYISLLIKKISGNDQEEKLAHINCPDYKLIISAFDKIDIKTKNKLYNSICEMAHKFDSFYDFYIAQYRSDENKLKVIQFDDLPLFMFAGFYKTYTDNVNNLKYFTKMLGDYYKLIIIDNDIDINAFIISFMENKYNDEECYLDKNDSHDSEIYFNQLEFISVDFADFLKNELLVELKVDPNIIGNIKTSKIFESNTTISPDEVKYAAAMYDTNNVRKAISTALSESDCKDIMNRADKFISYIDYDCDQEIVLIPSSNSEQTISAEQDKKIQLSEEEMIHIYYDIIGRCYVYKADKINDAFHNLKNTKLKEKLEFILNSNMDILRSFKYSGDNIVNEISKALNAFSITSDISFNHNMIYIIRNLYNKYIYDSKLPTLIDICLKYKNIIQDEVIYDIIMNYIFNRNPVRFLSKILEDYYNRPDEEIDTIEYYSDLMKDCFGVPKWDE